MKSRALLQCSAALTLLGLFPFANAQGVCPAVGQDTNCGTIITITDRGATVSNTGQPPYDGVEDTLVGVVNNSRVPISTIGLSSAAPIFSFDGDGIDSYGIPGNARDATGYGGPNAYFSNIAPNLATVNFIVPIAAHGGTAYFSLEGAIASATACTTLINNAIAPAIAAGTGVSGTFTPNLGFSLSQAAAVCGFSDFDWQQKITSWPKPSPLFQVGNSVPLSAPPPFLDPPPGGYTYELTHGYPNGDHSYPFYYDPNSGELKTHETATTLSFSDAPSDPCLFGGSGSGCGGKTALKGQRLAFTTHLAGVNFDGTAVDLGIGFSWTSTFNGTSGGTATTKNNLPTDPGSGTGGVTIVSIQQTSNYGGVGVTSVNGVSSGPQALVAGNVCNGVFSGTFDGDVIVSEGQNCSFENGTINGTIYQTGGSLQLNGVLVSGDVQVSGSGVFSIGGYSEVDGNFMSNNLSPGQAASQVCDTTVMNNVEVHNNGSPVQLGSDSPSSCGGNVIGGNLEVHNNTAPTSMTDNTVGGNLHDHNNAAMTSVSGNQVTNFLQCDGNTAVTGSGNSARAKSGQCAAL